MILLNVNFEKIFITMFCYNYVLNINRLGRDGVEGPPPDPAKPVSLGL